MTYSTFFTFFAYLWHCMDCPQHALLVHNCIFPPPILPFCYWLSGIVRLCQGKFWNQPMIWLILYDYRLAVHLGLWLDHSCWLCGMTQCDSVLVFPYRWGSHVYKHMLVVPKTASWVSCLSSQFHSPFLSGLVMNGVSPSLPDSS
jgi:hypothetical protein